MAVTPRFGRFYQDLVKYVAPIVHSCAAMAMEGCAYLYEAIGDLAAPQVGGAKVFAGHDHGTLYGGAPIPRGGVSFSSGGRSPLFSATIYADYTWTPIDGGVNIFFDWNHVATTGGGAPRIAYVSPGITSIGSIPRRTQNGEPVGLDCWLRIVWPAAATVPLLIKAVCADASEGSRKWEIPDGSRPEIEAYSAAISPNAEQQEVHLRLPCTGDYWNSIHFYAKKASQDPGYLGWVFDTYDIAISETDPMSQPASPGKVRYR